MKGRKYGAGGAKAGLAGLVGLSLIAAGPIAAAHITPSVHRAAVHATGTFTTYAPTGYLPQADWNPFGQSGSTCNTAVGVLAFSPLAIQSNTPRDGGEYFYPQLASSWGYTHHFKDFVVHLRPHLKWSNGKPLTSQDVVTSWDLYGLTGAWVGAQIQNVYAPNSSTVVFVRKRPGFSLAFAGQVLTLYIAPASIYQKFVPSKATFQKMMAVNDMPSSQQKPYKKLLTQLTADAKKLIAFNPGPAGLVTAGPYTVKAFSPGEVLLQKNPNNWAAANVHVQNVDLINQTGTEAVQNAAVAGKFDAFGYQPTTPLYDAIMSRNRPYIHYMKPKPFLTPNGLFYNFKDYPYNKVQVRQAIAYVVNRNAVMKLSDPVAGVPNPIPAGVPLDYIKAYLSPAQIKTLNPYHRNLKKAAQLLNSVGFKKKHGTWYMPNGKPFKITIISITTLASWDLTAEATANELTQFGIPSKMELRDVGSFGQEMVKGEYPMYGGYVFMWPFQPWGSLGAIFSYWGQGGISFKTNGQVLPPATKGDVGFGFPTHVTVPGIGTVDPAKLAWQFQYTSSKAQQDQIMYKLVKTMNYECWPFVEYFQDQSFFYSTKNFTDWPVHRSFFDLVGDGSANYFLTVAEENGYVRPK